MNVKAPKPRRPHGELKPLVINLAEEIVEGEGLGGLNARRLALAADCSVGTLYNLFGHLDGIVRAVNMSSIAMLGQALQQAVDAAPEDPEQRLIAMADTYFDFATQHPHRWETMFRFRSETDDDASMTEAQERLFVLLRSAVGGQLEDNVLRAMWAAVHGVAELAINRHLSGVVAGTERDYARLIVMAGLRGIAALKEEGKI